jgi:hypothetical protein
VREGKIEFTRSSRTCFKSRRRHGEREQVLASRREAWRSRASPATWRGEEGPAEARQAVGAALEGTWRRIKRRGGSWGSGKWPAGSGRVQRENKEREGLEVDDED